MDFNGKIKVGIIGAAGFTAGELLRILVNHPCVEIVFAQSSSHAGEPLWSAHADLIGETDLRFVSSVITSEVPSLSDVDVLFLCSGHGKAKPFVKTLPDSYKGATVWQLMPRTLSMVFRKLSGGKSREPVTLPIPAVSLRPSNWPSCPWPRLINCRRSMLPA